MDFDEQISYIVDVSIVDFEQVNVGRVVQVLGTWCSQAFTDLSWNVQVSLETLPVMTGLQFPFLVVCPLEQKSSHIHTQKSETLSH